MAIAFVAATGQTAGTNSPSTTPPSGFSADNLLILAFSDPVSRTVTTDFAGYTFVREVTDGTTWRTRYYTRIAQAGDTTVTAAMSGSGRWVTQQVAYSGVDTTAPLLVEDGQAQASTSDVFSAPAITNSDANAWAVYHGGVRGITGGSWTPGAGLTERIDTDGTLTAANVTAEFADSDGPVTIGAHTYSGTASQPTSGIGDAWAAYLKPASAGGGTGWVVRRPRISVLVQM